MNLYVLVFYEKRSFICWYVSLHVHVYSSTFYFSKSFILIKAVYLIKSSFSSFLIFVETEWYRPLKRVAPLVLNWQYWSARVESCVSFLSAKNVIGFTSLNRGWSKYVCSSTSTSMKIWQWQSTANFQSYVFSKSVLSSNHFLTLTWCHLLC